MYDGFDKSLASMTLDERIKVTARAKAAREFKKFLDRDLNIRYMWSKLFKIMQNNCKAYMVTMKPNYVFETVYGKKGMKIICLDSDDFSADFTSFMLDLRDRVLGVVK